MRREWMLGLGAAVVLAAACAAWKHVAASPVEAPLVVAVRYEGGRESVAVVSAATLVFRFAQPMRREETGRALRIMRGGSAPSMQQFMNVRWTDSRTLVLGGPHWDMAEEALVAGSNHAWWFDGARALDGRAWSSRPQAFRTADRSVHSSEDALARARTAMVLSDSPVVVERQGRYDKYWLIVDSRREGACLSANVMPDGTVLPWTWRSVAWDDRIRILVVRDVTTSERLSAQDWDAFLARQADWQARYASGEGGRRSTLDVATRDLAGYSWRLGGSPEAHRREVLDVLGETDPWDVLVLLRPSIAASAPCHAGEGVIECSLAAVRWDGYLTSDSLGAALADVVFGHELLHVFGWQHHWTNDDCGPNEWACIAPLVAAWLRAVDPS